MGAMAVGLGSQVTHVPHAVLCIMHTVLAYALALPAAWHALM